MKCIHVPCTESALFTIVVETAEGKNIRSVPLCRSHTASALETFKQKVLVCSADYGEKEVHKLIIVRTASEAVVE